MRMLAALVVAVTFLGVAPRAAADPAWVWPVEGRVLTPYANDNARPYAGGMHRGVDIAAGVGTGVVAARAGTVTHAGVVGSSGLTVAIRTVDAQYLTSYLHLSSAAVSKGDAVVAGTRVGESGTSGRPSAAEPHLHLGVRLADAEDRYVDPLSLLPARAGPVTPAAPVPAPVPVRVAPQAAPVPAAAPARAVRVRTRAPARARPQGTFRPGPVVVRAPLPAALPARAGRASTAPAAVPVGPVAHAARAPARARAERIPERPAAHPAHTGHGRELALAGLGLVAAVLFGGALWRGVTRANAAVNSGTAGAAGAIRDRSRFGPLLKGLRSS